jgi:hypothetical protein
MRPVPQRGTGGARGGLYIIRKKVFSRAKIINLPTSLFEPLINMPLKYLPHQRFHR